MKSQADVWQIPLKEIHLPRWDELPELELYMDQLVTLVERYVHPFKMKQKDDHLLTPAMVNNYVKLKLLPAPHKKRYDKRHLARLIIITILKQAFDIGVVSQGLDWQTESGLYKQAYNHFCSQLEETIQLFMTQTITSPAELKMVEPHFRPIQLATIALVAKLMAENSLNDLIHPNTKEEVPTHDA